MSRLSGRAQVRVRELSRVPCLMMADSKVFPSGTLPDENRGNFVSTQHHSNLSQAMEVCTSIFPTTSNGCLTYPWLVRTV